MPKQSGFLRASSRFRTNIMRATENLAKQYMLDTLQIAVNRAFGSAMTGKAALLDVMGRCPEGIQSGA